ncbi:MAG: hypothetical protein IJN70_05045 [Clostridia bacterium]|nr:hypothetical protein [Clostridia bacterium]
MNKKKAAAAVISLTAGAVTTKLTADKLKEKLSSPDSKRRLQDTGHKAAMKIVKKISDSVSDKGIPYLNRYDDKGFLEGNGYFLASPAENAKWQAGYSKASVIPPVQEGDYYIGGYLAFPPNKMNGIMNEQMVRAIAVSDGSDRGIHVFAVIDCIGISGTDIRDIRLQLSDLISEKNILSVNISATHCHSGIDTDGLWGNLPKIYKHNKKEVKKGKKAKPISGKNEGFMLYLKKTAARVIRQAVENMTTGEMYYAQLPVGDYVRDKRPPYVTVNDLTNIRFVPDGAGKEISMVFMAAHPVCYGDKQREASRDFPGYLCDAMEEMGFDTMFIQGAEAAVATNRGPHIPDGLTTDEGLRAYGKAIADYVANYDKSAYKKLSPLINVILSEVFLPSGNEILELAAKLRIVNNSLVRITTVDDGNKEDKSYDLTFVTEVGFAVLGNELSIAMVPGELMPEIAIGGAFEDWESYNGTKWDKPSLKEILGTEIAVAGLCNDFIGYIVPDNDYGSILAPLHYEESASAGCKTASNIVSAFQRMKKNAEKITVHEKQTVKE